MKVLYPLFTLIGIACLTSNPAQGHHALAANYDTDSVGTIEGVIVEVFWANPHIHYYLEVVNDGGATELWDIESSNLSNMVRSGWTKETVQVGDRIRVSGHLGRGGIRRLDLDRESLEMLE